MACELIHLASNCTNRRTELRVSVGAFWNYLWQWMSSIEKYAYCLFDVHILWFRASLYSVDANGRETLTRIATSYRSARRGQEWIPSEEYGYYTIGSDWKWMISIIHFTGYGRILSAFTYTTRLIGIGITTLDEQYRMNTRNDEPYMATLLLLWKRSWKQSWYTWICMYITTSLHSENW